MKIIICKIENSDSQNILISYKLNNDLDKFYLTCKIDGSDIEDLFHILIYREAVKRINKLKNSLTLESILFKKF